MTESGILVWLRSMERAYEAEIAAGNQDDVAQALADNYGEAAAEIERLQARVRALEAELSEAIEGWADGANYKGEYLKAKHGDEDGIAKARAVLQSSGK